MEKSFQRVAVAMSGGLDSAMALALLKEEGYDVVGMTMRLWREPAQGRDPALADIESARAICQQLNVEHHVIDLREPFFEQIVCYFLDEYAHGRTPNPCIYCNRLIKFGLLREHARKLGADALATGHYARITHSGGRYHLLKGRDRSKDQSYFLYTLNQQQLAETLFPLGEHTKAKVRAWAAARNLSVAERPESQDVCFIRDGDYRRFIAEQQPGNARPGPIYNRSGKKLGEHQGLPFYTIGQRSGLGISAPQALYVIEIDIERNVLIVGYANELGHQALVAREVNFISGDNPPQGDVVRAKIRYLARPVTAQLYVQAANEVHVYFEYPLRDITPGQAVVFYKGRQVLGGGIITRALESSGQPK